MAGRAALTCMAGEGERGKRGRQRGTWQVVQALAGCRGRLGLPPAPGKVGGLQIEGEALSGTPGYEASPHISGVHLQSVPLLLGLLPNPHRAGEGQGPVNTAGSVTSARKGLLCAVRPNAISTCI